MLKHLKFTNFKGITYEYDFPNNPKIIQFENDGKDISNYVLYVIEVYKNFLKNYTQLLKPSAIKSKNSSLSIMIDTTICENNNSHTLVYKLNEDKNKIFLAEEKSTSDNSLYCINDDYKDWFLNTYIINPKFDSIDDYLRRDSKNRERLKPDCSNIVNFISDFLSLYPQGYNYLFDMIKIAIPEIIGIGFNSRSYELKHLVFIKKSNIKQYKFSNLSKQEKIIILYCVLSVYYKYNKGMILWRNLDNDMIDILHKLYQVEQYNIKDKFKSVLCINT